MIGEHGLPLLDALVDCGMMKSKGEARRMIRQNAVRVAGEVVTDEMLVLTATSVVSPDVQASGFSMVMPAWYQLDEREPEGPYRVYLPLVLREQGP